MPFNVEVFIFMFVKILKAVNNNNYIFNHSLNPLSNFIVKVSDAFKRLIPAKMPFNLCLPQQLFHEDYVYFELGSHQIGCETWFFTGIGGKFGEVRILIEFLYCARN
jgi:hypothetical protein